MRTIVRLGVGIGIAGIVAYGGCASTDVSTPIPDSGNPGLPDGGGPGTLDGSDPRQKLVLEIDPSKSSIARKGVLRVKVTIPVGGKSASVKLEAPAGSGLTATPQIANAEGQAVLELKASDTAPTKPDQKARVVAEGFDGTTRGEATLELELRGAPGELDTTWGVAGFAELSPDVIDAMLVPAGGIYIANSTTSLAELRLLRDDGTVDAASKCEIATGAGLEGIASVKHAFYAVVRDAARDRQIRKVTLPCTVSTALAVPSGHFDKVSAVQALGARIAVLGYTSQSVVGLFDETSPTTLVPATWGSGGYATGSTGVPRVIQEGASEDTLFTSESDTFATGLSKAGIIVNGPTLLTGELVGTPTLGAQATPVTAVPTATDITIRAHLSAGIATNRFAVPSTLPGFGGRGAAGVASPRNGAVVAFGVQGTAPGEVFVVRLGADGTATKEFGQNGLASFKRPTTLPNVLSTVRRVLTRDGFAYVLVYATGGVSSVDSYMMRIWL